MFTYLYGCTFFILSQCEICPYLVQINSLFYLPLPIYLYFVKIKPSVDKFFYKLLSSGCIHFYFYWAILLKMFATNMNTIN